MPHVGAIGALAQLTAPTLGVFRGEDARRVGISKNQLASMRAHGVVTRVLPNVYRMTAVAASPEQQLRAALAWAGPRAVAAGRSAAMLYGLDGAHTDRPEIVVPEGVRARCDEIIVHHARDRRALMVRHRSGIPTTGVEATLLLLAHVEQGEALEVACEDARRRRLTSLRAIDAYLDRWQQRGRPGVRALRTLVAQLDPVHPARSKLEVLTRRLLVANRLGDFVRELPLTDGGRRFSYDFAFVRERVILEVNGHRWHGDPADFERDQAKWSVPARHGFRLVLATWEKVTQQPQALIAEMRATLAA
jgi:very-short-patch-repair endonuclease